MLSRTALVVLPMAKTGRRPRRGLAQAVVCVEGVLGESRELDDSALRVSMVGFSSSWAVLGRGQGDGWVGRRRGRGDGNVVWVVGASCA